jgi:hypothetical protein
MTGAISPANLKIEFSASSTTGWNDGSGFITSIEVAGGDRKAGSVYTYSGEYGITTLGKINPLVFTLKGVYEKSTAATNPYQWFRTYFASASTMWIRYSPEGGATGDKRYMISGRVAICPPVAGGGADDPNPLLFEAQVHSTGEVTESVVT